jgi:hypothetical protein
MGVHESKAESSSHSPTTRASRRVPSLHPRDLASFAPVPEHQDRRRGICCRGHHGTSRNAGLASLHYTVAAQATASAGFPFPLYRFRGSGCVVAGSFCAPRGGPAPGATAALCYGGARGQRRRRNSARALMRVRCVSIGAAVVVALSRPAHAMDLPRCRRFPFLTAVVVASFFQKRHRGSPINFYPRPGLASGLPLVSALLSASTLEWPSSPSVHGVVCA